MYLIPRGDINLPLLRVVLSLSTAVDLVSPVVFNHHIRVAYASYEIAKVMGLYPENREKVFLAGALHDIGALSVRERVEALKFESIYTPEIHNHAENGFKLLKLFEPFREVAQIVRYHHRSWNHGQSQYINGERIPIESHVVHLADRIDSLFHPDGDVLQQVSNIRDRIKALRGTVFNPDAVDAFLELSYKEYFWFDLSSKILATTVYSYVGRSSIFLDEGALNNLAKLFSHIIDFRSRFTATHSAGVAAVAEKLAEIHKFSVLERKLIRIAGYLHDIGKLVVPLSILEVSRKLSQEEYNIIKMHPFYTYKILETIEGFELINTWGSLHHEKIDGSGYPFHLKKESLPLGAIIVALADVYTALTEDRPYREAMPPRSALSEMEKMVLKGKLDSDVFSTLKGNLDEIDEYRKREQAEAYRIYEDFWRE
ncbi:MAG: HD domain-containing protein [Synergistetes bacterium]|nr:HD domain-containing protein [Synergistota bacterium]